MSERQGPCASCGKLDKYKTRDWCAACYQRWLYNGRPESGPPRINLPRGDTTRICSACGERVDRKSYTKSLGWCKKCERKWEKAGRPEGGPASVHVEPRVPEACPICSKVRLLSLKWGWCNSCTQRWRNDGMPEGGPIPLGPPPRWHGKLISNADFQRYINSKAWKTKRRLRLKMDDYRCQGCGSISGLHVHHRTYERFRNEIMEDLITVCGSCHALIHKMHRISPDSLDIATGKFLLATADERKVLELQEEQPAGPKKCSIAGCAKEATRRYCRQDICAMHEMRLRNFGTTEGRHCTACDSEINDNRRGWTRFCTSCRDIWGYCGHRDHEGERLVPAENVRNSWCRICRNRDAREKRRLSRV